MLVFVMNGTSRLTSSITEESYVGHYLPALWMRFVSCIPRKQVSAIPDLRKVIGSNKSKLLAPKATINSILVSMMTPAALAVIVISAVSVKQYQLSSTRYYYYLSNQLVVGL
jgi:hypothetical protein